MNVLMFPTLGCNLSCLYCFQRPRLPRPSAEPHEIDWRAVGVALRRLNESFKSYWGTPISEVVLHGGEPTSVPIDVLERLVGFLSGMGFKVSIQSNIYNITEDHLKLFKRYGVTVGASVDGFPDINLLRGFFDQDGSEIAGKSAEYRRRAMENLEEIARLGLCGGVIIILHEANAGTPERLARLKEFFRWLEGTGVEYARLNPMYAHQGSAKRFELSNDKLAAVLIDLYEFTRDLGVRCSPLEDVRRSLLGDRNVVCWFGGCHFYDSHVWAVDWEGNILSCDRAIGQEGFVRPQQLPHTDMFRMQVRTIALLQTELRDDRYAHLHRGGCPAESPDGDWRRPSRFVPAFDRLFQHAEADLKRALPGARLASEYGDKIDYVRRIDSGQLYDIWSGGFR